MHKKLILEFSKTTPPIVCAMKNGTWVVTASKSDTNWRGEVGRYRIFAPYIRIGNFDSAIFSTDSKKSHLENQLLCAPAPWNFSYENFGTQGAKKSQNYFSPTNSYMTMWIILIFSYGGNWRWKIANNFGNTWDIAIIPMAEWFAPKNNFKKCCSKNITIIFNINDIYTIYIAILGLVGEK